MYTKQNIYVVIAYSGNLNFELIFEHCFKNTPLRSRAAFLKLGVAEQFLRGREMQLIFESTPGCLLKYNIKFKFILHSF